MKTDIAECSLAELVKDPLIGLVMKSDGIDRRELEALLERVAGEWARAAKRAAVPRSPSRLPTREAVRC
jgi:hypothetical protein